MEATVGRQLLPPFSYHLLAFTLAQRTDPKEEHLELTKKDISGKDTNIDYFAYVS